ncbi:hypothetical protein P8C59_004834 [Phyllachora maydis]|uniref:Uncharacterized protein n=1 Tax=Phyllachora maydis TaxID=1825666 RepID=A0AAD9I3M4_9PEZI|nr:hypothetical protein P8C59_004834 [Phyllachora maydis]
MAGCQTVHRHNSGYFASGAGHWPAACACLCLCVLTWTGRDHDLSTLLFNLDVYCRRLTWPLAPGTTTSIRGFPSDPTVGFCPETLDGRATC